MRTPTRNRILVAALILAVAVLAGLLRPRDANAEGYTFYAMENLDAGDIVVRNIGTAYGVEKSTTSADTSVVGVVKYDTLATEGVLVISSNVAIIHVTGTVTNGQWIYNSATGGFGISTGTPIVGTFAQALADKGVGAGVDADQVLAYIRPPAVMAGGGAVGAAFPGSPLEGDLFYHTTHDVEFLYENGVWNSKRSYGPLTLYVDAGAGSDATGQGFASGASATATIQYCIDNNVPAIFGGDITMNITAAAYAEDAIIKAKLPNGDYVIKLVGTLSESVAEAVVDSGTQGTGATQGSIVDAAPAWVDDAHNRLILQFEDDTTTAALQGDQYIIDITTDAGNIMTIVGTFDAQPVAGDTYTIQTWGTTISSVKLGAGQKSVELWYVHLNDQGGIGLTDSHCSLQGWYSKISDSAATVCNFADKFSNVLLDFCVIENLRARVIQGFLRLADCHMLGGQSLAVLQVSNLGNASITNGTVIDADSDNLDTVVIENIAFVEWFATAAGGYPRVRNADQAGKSGILTQKGGGSNTTSNIQFSNNTADETTDAAKFGWSD